MRLIDRSEIYKRFFDGGNGIARIHVGDIDTIPDVDFQAVIHAKWQYHLMPLALKCSYCKRTVTWKRKIDYNYCPYCGAKIDM